MTETTKPTELEAGFSGAAPLLGAQPRRCTSHHHACDCREAEMSDLLSEIMEGHADPQYSEYNNCDDDPCMWCQRAAALLPPNAKAQGRFCQEKNSDEK